MKKNLQKASRKLDSLLFKNEWIAGAFIVAVIAACIYIASILPNN